MSGPGVVLSDPGDAVLGVTLPFLAVDQYPLEGRLDLTRVPGVDEFSRAAGCDYLLRSAVVGRDDRKAARARFDDGDAEVLNECGVGEHAAAGSSQPVQDRDIGVGMVLLGQRQASVK